MNDFIYKSFPSTFFSHFRVTLYLSQETASNRISSVEGHKCRGQSLDDSVEEELYSSVSLKGGIRCPFVRATSVLDSNLQNFWGKVSR